MMVSLIQYRKWTKKIWTSLKQESWADFYLLPISYIDDHMGVCTLKCYIGVKVTGFRRITLASAYRVLLSFKALVIVFRRLAYASGEFKWLLVTYILTSRDCYMHQKSFMGLTRLVIINCIRFWSLAFVSHCIGFKGLQDSRTGFIGVMRLAEATLLALYMILPHQQLDLKKITNFTNYTP